MSLVSTAYGVSSVNGNVEEVGFAPRNPKTLPRTSGCISLC